MWNRTTSGLNLTCSQYDTTKNHSNRDIERRTTRLDILDNHVSKDERARPSRPDGMVVGSTFDNDESELLLAKRLTGFFERYHQTPASW